MRKERPLFAADRHAVSPLGERCSGAGRYARLCTEAQGFDPGGAVAARWRRGLTECQAAAVCFATKPSKPSRSSCLPPGPTSHSFRRRPQLRRGERRPVAGGEARRAPAYYEVELVELRKGRSAGCFRPAPHREQHGASERSSLHGSSLRKDCCWYSKYGIALPVSVAASKPVWHNGASKRAEQHATRRSSRSVSRNVGR